MRRVQLATGVLAVVLATGVLIEGRQFHSRAQTLVGIIDPATVELKPLPIRAEWILEGQPVTMGREIAHTDDDSTKVYVWQTTRGRFNWFYDLDEVVTVLDGEVFVTDDSKVERRLGPGDVAFFPQGSKAMWRVPDHVRKIATLKTTLPEPIAGVVRWIRMAKSFVRPSSAFASEL